MSNKDVDAMSRENNEKRVLVPQLRFPEFREAVEWKAEPLKKLAKRSTSKNAKGEHTRVLTNSAEHGVIDQRDYFEKDIANQGNLEGYYIVENGDYVYNPRMSTSAPVGPISKNNVGTGVMSPLYTVFRFASSDNDFFAHYFKSTHWHHYMRRASSTGVRHDRISITNDDFMDMPLPVSTPKEQQKIADSLTSVDKLITAETQKLDALKTQKKGLMQQLFPRDGKTVPRLRFPEFRKAGNWTKIAAGQIFSNRTEKGESRLPIYSVTMNDGLVPRASLDRRIEDVAESGGNKIVRRGDIAYNMMRMWQGALGVAPLDCMVSPAYIVLEPQAGVNPLFFYFLLKLPETLRVLTAHSRGLTEDRLRLYYDDFAKVPLLCPSPSEQERIADSLSSLDGLISVHNSKIDTLKTHKKRLMQLLFPGPDEVYA
ncbi:restriction endonuclease subunit S [Burkholderia sp. Se-20378]|uniref:restriction endonuclease subunit S n=1 Tax=Burkholderia sp. Se-20378 TaxID=2703899 RepID=UPI001980F2C7|nr:restriction endonuclease subunit S [Burkholderia sp. Se-20378]MBN3769792.1 restriction endonuclease subunit S [Burkholderia sp. Se-20378]